MALNEEDREDLFAEMGSYSPRWELCIPGEPEQVVIGQRHDGRLAIYFGQDPCFHFNSAGELLRAFSKGELYRTHGTCLARLQRCRTPTETQLLRSDLEGEELHQFLHHARTRLQRLALLLLEPSADSVKILRASEPSPGGLREVAGRLAELADPLPLAPAYPTRRR